MARYTAATCMASFAEAGRLPDEISGVIVEIYGFVPNLFFAQAELPAALEAESALIHAILLKGSALDRAEKNTILSAVAAANGNRYIFALHNKRHDGVSQPALLEFVSKLARFGPGVSKADIDCLLSIGLHDLAILELVSTVALGNMLCTLADAIVPVLDEVLTGEIPYLAPVGVLGFNSGLGPYIKSEADVADHVAGLLREQYGFVPAVFRSQSLWPELLAVEAKALELVLFSEDHLTRVQKESILLAISAKNLNAYGTTLHSQVLTVFGVSTEQCDAIVRGLQTSSLAESDKVLLAQVSRLAGLAGHAHGDIDCKALREAGFTRQQILQAIATAGLGGFFNTLQFGLGVPPDFPPQYVFSEKDLYPAVLDSRPTSEVEVRSDPDADVVARVQAGETDAFEALARRHMRRIFGILNGMLGNYDEAHEATQEVFVKAFEHISDFQGRSKFSTWLTSIAINTGTELLRQRKPVVPLDDVMEEDFRPRRVMSWGEDPEALFAAAQMKALVREAVLRLPQKYRVVLLLRDISQVSTEDAAEALGLSVPALKARVLRGRLMLRESLAAHFIPSEKKNA